MEKLKGQPTPYPWHVGSKQAEIIIYDESGWAIANCTVYHGKESGEPKENAAFIVKAVNSHDALRTIALRYLSLNELNTEIERLNGPVFNKGKGK